MTIPLNQTENIKMVISACWSCWSIFCARHYYTIRYYIHIYNDGINIIHHFCNVDARASHHHQLHCCEPHEPLHEYNISRRRFATDCCQFIWPLGPASRSVGRSRRWMAWGLGTGETDWLHYHVCGFVCVVLCCIALCMSVRVLMMNIHYLSFNWSFYYFNTSIWI